MTWYSLYKLAALEPNWWNNFYHHLSQAFPYVMNIPQVQSSFVSSGVDGNKTWYSFKATRQTPTGPDEYDASIRFEYSDSLPYNAQFKWENSSLKGVQTAPGVELVKIHWFILKNAHNGKGMEIAGRGFILAQNATPVAVLTQIKNAILEDMQGDDDDDTTSPEPQVPTLPSGRLQPV